MKGGEEGEMGRGGRKRGKVVICNITPVLYVLQSLPLYPCLTSSFCPYCLR